MLYTHMKLDFDDVLIEPRFSRVESRADVMLDILPIVNANMRSIATKDLLIAINSAGAYSASHRFQSIEDQVRDIELVSDIDRHWCTVGISEQSIKDARTLLDAGANNLCIDVAHGANKKVLDFIECLKSKRILKSKHQLMVGNFGSPYSITEFLYISKVVPDYIKLGVGPGSMCRTRQVTGVGYPQISLISESRSTVNDFNIRNSTRIKLVADGGVKNSADFAKALVAGADIVMSGSLFRDCTETSNVYRGSASAAEYEHQGKSDRTPEGVETQTDSNTNVSEVVDNLRKSLASTMSYINATSLEDMRRAEIVQVSNNAKII